MGKIAVKLLMQCCLVFLAVGSCWQAHAESLRCVAGSVSEGDSKASVVYKCGQPTLADTTCAPVYLPGSPYPVSPAYVGSVVPCQPVEEWLYDRGTGNLLATVRFKDGRVLSIRYGRQPE